jgi:hypothetical protein
MSTIKSSNEHLTINADGSSKDIKFQANGVEKASISSAGAFTSTTIDATKLTGNLPAINGASLTNLPADSTKLPLAGGTMTGNLSFSNSDPQISNSNGNFKISAEDSLVIEMDNNSQNTGGETITVKTDPSTTAFYITEAGKMEFGAISTNGSSYGFRIEGGNQEHTLYQSQAGTGNFDFVRYYNGHGYIGRIRHSSGTLSFENLSDYRRKENVVPLANATTKLKQLNPIRYNLITDETNTPVDGFLAHEVSSACPEAVSGEKDAVDSEGNPEYQFIDSTKLIPLLVKTIQELEARITALEG